jgi:hypothetical protein
MHKVSLVQTSKTKLFHNKDVSSVIDDEVLDFDMIAPSKILSRYFSGKLLKQLNSRPFKISNFLSFAFSIY